MEATASIAPDEPPRRIYQYQPLDPERMQFRLLHILPDLWGPPKSAGWIIVQDSCISVRQNLLSRLLPHCAQQPTQGAEFLWIDALCIDQENIHEQEVQVKRMGGLYHFAKRVLIWLGLRAGNDLHSTEDVPQWSKNIFEPLLDDLNYHGRRAIGALRDLAETAYWTRMWIVQEVVLAKRAYVMAGDEV
ncbi:hypothetical protein EJ04DRAFT_449524, partial [Polyplosphaeria fusca]